MWGGDLEVLLRKVDRVVKGKVEIETPDVYPSLPIRVNCLPL